MKMNEFFYFDFSTSFFIIIFLHEQYMKKSVSISFFCRSVFDCDFNFTEKFEKSIFATIEFDSIFTIEIDVDFSTIS